MKQKSAPFDANAVKSMSANLDLNLLLSGKKLFWRMPFAPRELEKAVGTMLQTAYSGYVELELLLVNDGEMTQYNKEYMDCDGPTNILSFPMSTTGERHDVCLGSLILSVDTLHREAQLYGQNPGVYCLRLLAHGLGHLSGLDHGQKMDIFCGKMEKAVKPFCTSG